MAQLEGQSGGVLVLGDVVAGVAVAQGIVRPRYQAAFEGFDFLGG
jgi:hypothetical protein